MKQMENELKQFFGKPLRTGAGSDECCYIDFSDTHFNGELYLDRKHSTVSILLRPVSDPGRVVLRCAFGAGRASIHGDTLEFFSVSDETARVPLVCVVRQRSGFDLVISHEDRHGDRAH